MTRRPFLDNPGAWTSTTRNAQTSTDYACAVTMPRGTDTQAVAVWIATILTAATVAILIWA